MTDDEKARDQYKVLTDHYFHEGNLMLKRNQFFVALNFSLFTALSIALGKEMLPPTSLLMLIICLMGAIMSVMWIIMTRRAELYIDARVKQMRKLEAKLEYKIATALSLGKNWSSSRLFMLLGFLFCLCWPLFYWSTQ